MQSRYLSCCSFTSLSYSNFTFDYIREGKIILYSASTENLPTGQTRLNRLILLKYLSRSTHKYWLSAQETYRNKSYYSLKLILNVQFINCSINFSMIGLTLDFFMNTVYDSSVYHSLIFIHENVPSPLFRKVKSDHSTDFYL